MRILVVDDDWLAGQVTGAVLEDAAYEVVTAEDGIAAAALLDADPAIDLVVSDMNMPGPSGIELFRQLRARGATLPFILLTGDDPAGLLAQEPRLDACLMKDADLPETLAPAVAAVLARHGR